MAFRRQAGPGKAFDKLKSVRIVPRLWRDGPVARDHVPGRLFLFLECFGSEEAMSKREESKYKINRRLGVNLWGRAKSPLNKREYGPGQHGQRRKKPSEYGLQLHAKQKLKGYYGNITERQFRKT